MVRSTLVIVFSLLAVPIIPVDCALGFHHDDCLPGTAGYDDPKKFEKVDDEQCRSYGLVFGTAEYADCRVKLESARKHGVFN